MKRNIKDEVAKLEAFQEEIHKEITNVAKDKGLLNENCHPIYDGISNIEGYVTSHPKVMWILKEAWGKRDENGMMHGGGNEIWECWTPGHFNTPTWLPMIYMIYGIRKGIERVEYCDMPYADMNMVDLLKKTAYINLSKMPGDTTSGNMKAEYKLWRDIVLKQVEVYNPDIIIFCGTFEVVKSDFVDPDTVILAKTPTDEIAHIYRDSHGRILVNALHPAQRRIPRDYYIDEIVDQLRDINNHSMR